MQFGKLVPDAAMHQMKGFGLLIEKLALLIFKLRQKFA
jgi:hypothetical protein